MFRFIFTLLFFTPFLMNETAKLSFFSFYSKYSLCFLCYFCRIALFFRFLSFISKKIRNFVPNSNFSKYGKKEKTVTSS